MKFASAKVPAAGEAGVPAGDNPEFKRLSKKALGEDAAKEGLKADIAASTGVHDTNGVVKMLLAGATVVQLAAALLRNGVPHLATLRAIPGLNVIRPADPNETVAAWRVAVEHRGPTAIVLSRQNVSALTDGSAVSVGAKTIISSKNPAAVIVATGSELGVAAQAEEVLRSEGIPVNVVSMPSWDLFALQSDEYRASVLPAGIPKLEPGRAYYLPAFFAP